MVYDSRTAVKKDLKIKILGEKNLNENFQWEKIFFFYYNSTPWLHLSLVVNHAGWKAEVFSRDPSMFIFEIWNI